MNAQGNSCLIMSYEAGVLFIPKYVTGYFTFFPFFHFLVFAKENLDMKLSNNDLSSYRCNTFFLDIFKSNTLGIAETWK